MQQLNVLLPEIVPALAFDFQRQKTRFEYGLCMIFTVPKIKKNAHYWYICLIKEIWKPFFETATNLTSFESNTFEHLNTRVSIPI